LFLFLQDLGFFQPIADRFPSIAPWGLIKYVKCQPPRDYTSVRTFRDGDMREDPSLMNSYNYCFFRAR
jgi:hypothetical protein